MPKHTFDPLPNEDKVNALCQICFDNGTFLSPGEIAQRLECCVGDVYKDCRESFEKQAKKREAGGSQMDDAVLPAKCAAIKS